MKTILFACVHNAGRSQMAAAFFNMLVKPIEQVRGIRDDVRSRVETLIDRKGWR